jgi:hypothetical protein
MPSTLMLAGVRALVAKVVEIAVKAKATRALF